MERLRVDSLVSSSDEEENTLTIQDMPEEEIAPITLEHETAPEQQEQKDKRPKRSCSSCVNGNLLGLKLLLFIFYGGIGTVSVWLNHTQLTSRVTEEESLLIYGLVALFSILGPIVFGLLSDKTAHPKTVLGICLLLGGLIYPLILMVPPAHPYRHKDKLEWCTQALNKSKNIDNKPLGDYSSCAPHRLKCFSWGSELITDKGGCSIGCGGMLTIASCKYRCNDSRYEDEDEDYEYPNFGPEAQALVSSSSSSSSLQDRLKHAPPHLCVTDNPKYKHLCYAFDKDMRNIRIPVHGVSGYIENKDGKCHYPVKDGESDESLLSCSPLSPGCHVSCELKWNPLQDDQWNCHSDFVQWFASFSSFVGIHTVGTMLVISSTALLNSAILSMSHEHSGYFGCQYMYAVLGYALVPPGIVLGLEWVHDMLDIPWDLEYFVLYSSWLVVCGFLVSCLPYHAEWRPRPKAVGPMLRRWSCRGHTLIFFLMIAVLGCLQHLIDVLSFHQIRGVGGSLLIIAIGGAAAFAPSLLFIFRVDRVIDYCAYPNVFAIAFVVASLQFTGYAYLIDVEAEWSYLLRAMETFSILVVWIAASYTTYEAAPRSLAATCQAIIVTLYCCIGRGFGGILGFLGLSVVPKDLFLKILSFLSVVICVIYLTLQYCCLKPFPYAKQYEIERPGSAAPSGRYTPLKLINGKDKNIARDEDLDEKEMITVSE